MASRKSCKPCINNPAFTYTGTEQSPLHYGLSAEAYPLNAVLEGYDKRLWAVEVKNNRKVWVRKEESFKICTVSHEEPVITEQREQPVLTKSVKSITPIEPAKCIEPAKSVESAESIQPIEPMQPIEPIQPTEPIALLQDTEQDPQANQVPPTKQKKSAKKPLEKIEEEKKLTDYNIFLTYRLKQLKQENPTQENKKNYALALQEWKAIKNKPDDLRKILDEAKQNTKK